MLWILFSAFAAVHAILLRLVFRLQGGTAEWLLRALLVGLIADNLILASGQFAFQAPGYYGLSWLRYLAHVCLLPPLAYAALVVLRRGGVAWALTGKARLLCLLFVAAAIAVGFVTEIASLELTRETLLGHDRYASAHPSPPIASIATNVAILLMAAVLWRTANWPWLFAAALAIFIINGATAAQEWGIVAGNFAEVLFVAGWLVTLRQFRPD